MAIWDVPFKRLLGADICAFTAVLISAAFAMAGAMLKAAIRLAI
jgi:hypothetical protein